MNQDFCLSVQIRPIYEPMITLYNSESSESKFFNFPISFWQSVLGITT